MSVVADVPSEIVAKEPPRMLVSTWVELLKSNGDPEAVRRAQEMISHYFPDVESFLAYCRTNQIKVE